jgi:hypothetical protein
MSNVIDFEKKRVDKEIKEWTDRYKSTEKVFITEDDIIYCPVCNNETYFLTAQGSICLGCHTVIDLEK